MPNAIDLTTLANVQQYVAALPNVPTGSTAIISTLITNISQEAQTYCSRTFATGTYTDVFNVTGGSSISLRQYPIVSVQSVNVYGQPITQGSSTNGYISTGWVNDDSRVYLLGGGGSYPAPAGYSTFPKGIQNISITYTAGYATIPYDLQESVTEYVAIRLLERTHPGTISENIEGQSTRYINAQDGDVKRIRKVWDRYKKPFAY